MRESRQRESARNVTRVVTVCECVRRAPRERRRASTKWVATSCARAGEPVDHRPRLLVVARLAEQPAIGRDHDRVGHQDAGRPGRAPSRAPRRASRGSRAPRTRAATRPGAPTSSAPALRTTNGMPSIAMRSRRRGEALPSDEGVAGEIRTGALYHTPFDAPVRRWCKVPRRCAPASRFLPLSFALARVVDAVAVRRRPSAPGP